MTVISFQSMMIHLWLCIIFYSLAERNNEHSFTSFVAGRGEKSHESCGLIGIQIQEKYKENFVGKLVYTSYSTTFLLYRRYIYTQWHKDRSTL